MRGAWKAVLELGNGQLGGMDLGDLALASSSCQDLNTVSAYYSGKVYCSEGLFSLRVAVLLGLWLMASETLKEENF